MTSLLLEFTAKLRNDTIKASDIVHCIVDRIMLNVAISPLFFVFVPCRMLLVPSGCTHYCK